MVTRIFALFALLFGINAFAGDTPFMLFECTFDQPSSAEFTFNLRFHDDSREEALEWASPFRRTTIVFDKEGHDSVKVHITTGLPLLAHAAPKEFRFNAPLVTGQFEFAMGIDPLTINGGDMLNLNCVKEKASDQE